MYLVGEGLAARMPRRQLGADLTRSEQFTLLRLADRLPLPTPAPVFCGSPSRDYPFAWGVVPWAEGAPAVDPLGPDAAAALGQFVSVLHQSDADSAPHNPYRASPLGERITYVRERLDALDSPDRRQLESVFEQGCDAEIDASPTWIHGDLHPKNIIQQDGEIVMVADWGDTTAGDPATDLATAWMTFREPDSFLSAYGEISDATIKRARGWALWLGLVLATTADDADFLTIGNRTLQNLIT